MDGRAVGGSLAHGPQPVRRARVQGATLTPPGADESARYRNDRGASEMVFFRDAIAAYARPARKKAAPKTPTKKPSGQSDRYEIATPAHTVTNAIATDRAIARPGRAVSDLAAAAGPIIRLNISSAPTTGTVMLVASAMTSRNASSIRRARTPRASATSGSAEENISGRNMTPITATDTAPITRMGSTSSALTPNP